MQGVAVPDINGLYFEQHGGGTATPLLLSAGLGGSASYWHPNLAALSGDRRVFAYDHRGTGRSDLNLRNSGTIAGMADDALTLLDALAIERADFLGHALGGLIGMHLALHRPDRVGKLIIVNGWAEPDPVTLLCFETRLALLRGSGPEAYVRAQPLFLYPSQWLSQHWPEIDLDLDGSLLWFPPIANVEARIEAVRSFRLASTFEASTLLITAEDDLLIPSGAGERLAAKLPDVQLAVMRWGGHACNVTDPDTFNRLVLDFLRS